MRYFFSSVILSWMRPGNWTYKMRSEEKMWAPASALRALFVNSAGTQPHRIRTHDVAPFVAADVSLRCPCRLVVMRTHCA